VLLVLEMKNLEVNPILLRKGDFSSLRIPLRNMLLLAFAFFSKLSLQKASIILMYHSIGSNGAFHNVEPIEFMRQMGYLRKRYAIVSLDDFVFSVKDGKKPSGRLVSITFDDGYHDFYLNVYDYFRKNKLSATIFVTTDYVGTKWPFNGNQSKMLTWEEIEEMSANGIEIGAHTVTHPNLQRTELKQAEHEILKSKEVIEKHIKKRVRFFSYPFGKYNNDIINITKSSGFEAALGGGGTIQKNADPFALSRIQVDSSVSFLLFQAQMTKAADWYKTFEKIAKRFLRALNLIR
jgi:peptidoglycan/xylan/chitin deacetylase (PgdA/CDA1 family)